ncbi:MAG: PQQ-dependent dehydrogenase, methanol/ethanol family [Steroidobacteraceae bacterium]
MHSHVPRRARTRLPATLAPLALALLASACGSGKPPTPATPTSFGQIDRARLLAADSAPGEWLTSGRDFGKGHYSPLEQINRDSVGRLGLAWSYSTGTRRGLEATPIVVDGVMYTSGVDGRVYALDARNGLEIWRFNPQVDAQVYRGGCCDAVNRGVAVWRGKVYVGAYDGRLYALDAADGHVLWNVDTIVDKARAYTSSGAPEVAGDVVVIGNAGAEYDARGYVSAYDLDSGQLAWRFYIVPGDPAKPRENPELELAAKTWDAHSRWDVGLGGTAWDGMAYDPELDLLYVGTGNAALYNRAKRSPKGGDNLFLTSILAINAHTGRLAWYYQEVPGDMWDYTATQPMILADLAIGGLQRKVLMHAPKNGIFYVLDRRTGELLSAKNFVPVNWTKGVDLKTGRATVDAAAVDYTTGPKLVYPSTMGGHNWNPMSYDPRTGLVYLPTLRAAMFMLDTTRGHEYHPGRINMGVTAMLSSGLQLGSPGLSPEVLRQLDALARRDPESRVLRTSLTAWDPIAQKAVWEVPAEGWWDHAGVLSTAGDLVFQGTDTGLLRVFDAHDGRVLKEIDTGSSIIAAPMSYAIDGVQYVAVMAAWGGGGWFITHPESAAFKYGNEGRILVYRLDGGPTPKPQPIADPGPLPEPPPLTEKRADVLARGGLLFAQNCSICHQNVPRSAVPDLRRMSAVTHQTFNDIVLRGARRPLGMPQWNDVFNDADADAMHAYLVSIAWEAYRQQQAGIADASAPVAAK